MKSNTALGKDSIPAESFKAAGLNALADMPEDFCNVLIVALYEKKGSKSDRVNYRGISLLSIDLSIDLCLHSPEPTDHSLRKKSPRGTVWLQTKKQQRGQDNCRQTGEGDVHCTEQGPLLVLCLYRSDKGL